jgi:hypothetical protein
MRWITTRHHRPAVARHSDDWPIDAGLQFTAPSVLGVEGVKLGQQTHGRERIPGRESAARKLQPAVEADRQRDSGRDYCDPEQTLGHAAPPASAERGLQEPDHEVQLEDRRHAEERRFLRVIS